MDLKSKRFVLIMETLLKCSTCEKDLPLDCFYNSKANSGRHGKQSECKECNNYASKNNPRYFIRHLLDSCKSSAKRRLNKGRTEAGIFLLTSEDILDLLKIQKGKCAVSGTMMDFEKHSPDKMSIDRKDNNLGYIVENIRLVTWQVNQAQSNHTDESFIVMCNKIAAINPREIPEENKEEVKFIERSEELTLKCKRWSEEDMEILKGYETLNKETQEELAIRLNRTEKAVRVKWNRLRKIT